MTSNNDLEDSNDTLLNLASLHGSKQRLSTEEDSNSLSHYISHKAARSLVLKNVHMHKVAERREGDKSQTHSRERRESLASINKYTRGGTIRI